MTGLLEALFNGLSLSSILILAALGLGVTFGVMRVINMAHGEMMMLGAYLGYVLTNRNGLSVFVSGMASLSRETARVFGIRWEPTWQTNMGIELNLFYVIPVVFLVVSLIGYLLEKGLIRFLYGRPLDTLLATWGVGLVLQQVTQLVFSGSVKHVDVPLLVLGQWTYAGSTFPHYRLFMIAFTAVCLVLVYLGFFYTTLGLKIRAVTQNRAMASAIGIRTGQVDGLTFAFGTGLAGVAGCILGGIYNVGPNMGQDYIVEAFMVVILGGMGQLKGVIAGGLVVGVARGVAEKFYANALIPGLFPVYITEVFSPIARITVLALVIGFIMLRPTGLVRSKERVYD